MMIFEIFIGIVVGSFCLMLLAFTGFTGWEFYKWVREEWECEQKRRNE